MISQFTVISTKDVERFGGKGANLGELTRAGLPVPPGFCVAAKTYRQFLSEAGLAAPIAALLADHHPDRPGEVPARIRALIVGSAVPTHIAAEISDAYATLGDTVPVAVRSSATAEDLPEASFAGQQDTYLGVRGAEAVVQAVRNCWASLWTDRAVAYRDRQGFDHHQVSLAIVIQRLVEADTAGVMFTANPVTGSREEILIDASWGLGESVVSGQVTPDSYRLSRGEPPQVLERTCGSKQTRIDLAAGGETICTAVPEADRGRLCLSDDRLMELAKLGASVEQHYGAPQDTEWAWSGHQLWLLQARPITSALSEQPSGTEAAPADTGEPTHGRMSRRIHDDIVEHYPGPFPLDHAAVVQNYQELLNAFGDMGIALPPAEQLIHLDDDGIATAAYPRPRLNRPISKITRSLRQGMKVDPASWAAGPGRRYADKISSLRKSEDRLRGLRHEAIIDHIEAALGLVSEIARSRFNQYVIPQTFRGVEVDAWLRLARLSNDLTQWDLLAGLDYTTAVIDRELHRLANLASSPAIRETLVSKPAREALDVLADQGEGREFLRQLEEFLDRHGARAMKAYLPFSTLSWREEPASLVATLGAMLRASDLKRSGDAQSGEELARRVANRLPAPLRARFHRTLRAYRAGHVAREASLYAIEETYVVARQGMREAARRLVEAGVIAETEDVRYLSLPELFGFLRNPESQVTMLDTVSRRRAKRAQAVAAWWGDRSSDRGAGELSGTAGSPGVVTASARIISGPDEFNRLQPGDVLVCQFTDPAWTPLFGLASAVVADTGGRLSHAAIVAREYGIPAVLGVGGATSTLHDGDVITVNGNTGRIIRKGR